MLTAFGLSVVGHAAWPVSLGATLSFAGLAAAAAGRWTPAGGLGLANLVTLLRLLLVLLPLAALPRLSTEILFAALLAAFVLDAIDGVVARRCGCASEFGAMFDGETDSALVLMLGLVLWLRHGFAAWVLVPGTLRYVYLVCLAIVPPSRARPWRSRLGRLAFLIGSALLLAAVVAPGLAGTVSAAVASLILGASFGYSFFMAYPPPWRAATSEPASLTRIGSFMYTTLLFLVAWSFLNVMVNVRYPASEPTGWYFLPSLDVTLLLAVFALLGLIGLRLPVWARVPLVVLVVFARGQRIGDGVTSFYFGKPFNLYTDLPLAPELVRYAHSTFPAWKFYAGAAAALAIVAALVLAVDRAIACAAGYLRRRRRILLFAGLVLPFAVASGFLKQDPRYNERYAGAFGSSVAPRFQREATFLLNVYDHRLSGMRAIADMQETLKHTPAHLERLHHANVYVIFVESYGMTVLERPSFFVQAVPALKAIQSDLSRHGFASASGRMDSATYGGMSWLAHATFLTGVRTGDQLQYDLLGVGHPRSLPRIAHEAGYHTILIQPNNNRRSSHSADFYDFDQTYQNWDFDYVGPAFAWASMPDQYVLDFIRREAIAKDKGPLFLVYNLISSHAPWSHVPTVVEDWSRVGNGEIYNNHPLKRAYTNWPDFSNAAEPYLRSILYDLDVLDSYIIKFVDDDSLIIVLGDHQPVSEVTDNSPSWTVPVHVISRDPLLIAPFVARGYAPGMIPGQAIAPMAAFLVDFLRDFSAGAP
jgi:phosphatidylglycerophosphate synthase